MQILGLGLVGRSKVELEVLWMVAKSYTTLKPWESLYVGICRAIIIPGFLKWCEMDFAFWAAGSQVAQAIGDRF